jgi:HD-like signal output (HDOD) protein/ActR/RegA family two-component response regulator
MISILFVDDDANVGAGLQRTLRSMREEWDMRFAQSGPEALKMLAKSPVDVIVTDMCMPDMDGAQLLAEIERLYPHIARIILSGQCDRQTALSAVGPTHLFLSKPCDKERLIEVVLRVHRLRAVLSERRVSVAVSGIRGLPTSPAVHLELLQAVSAQDASAQDVARIIQKDIALTAKLLQIVNSAFFGADWRATTALQAVNLLGTDLVQTLVVSFGIVRQLESDRSDKAFNRCWQHGIRTGAGARYVARDLGLNKREIDEAFTAGLLHDIGRLILSTLLTKSDRKIDLLLRNSPGSRLDIERAELGATHAEIGAYLLTLWGLPDSIIEATAFHHEPGGASESACVSTAVHVASVLTGDEQDSIDEAYLRKLGLLARLDHWKAEIAARALGDVA